QPRVPPAPSQPWTDLPKALELAKRPNAVIKVGGAGTLSREPHPFPDIWNPLVRVFDAWGFDRCLRGTVHATSPSAGRRRFRLTSRRDGRRHGDRCRTLSAPALQPGIVPSRTRSAGGSSSRAA